MQRHVDDAVPLLLAHAGERRVVVDAGVVHDDLDRTVLELAFEQRTGRLRIGEVECERAGMPAGREDGVDDRLGAVAAAVRVHEHLAAGGGERTRDRATDISAAAGDEGASGWTHGLASRSKAVRP